jgi:hypothetical protein
MFETEKRVITGTRRIWRSGERGNEKLKLFWDHAVGQTHRSEMEAQ